MLEKILEEMLSEKARRQAQKSLYMEHRKSRITK